MATSEERREVARKMRGITPIELFGYESLYDGICNAVARCIGFDKKPDSVGDFIDRLADLIEPQERTCCILQAYGDESEELDHCMEEIASTPEDTVACICQSCGHEFRYDRMVRPMFCPNCGAKVVG